MEWLQCVDGVCYDMVAYMVWCLINSWFIGFTYLQVTTVNWYDGDETYAPFLLPIYNALWFIWYPIHVTVSGHRSRCEY
jgi:hypothetical protein